MASSPALSQADWLGACRAAVAGLREVMREHPTSRERVVETGTLGEGGDRTLVIDQLAEDIVFAELERLHDAGAASPRSRRSAASWTSAATACWS